MKSVLIRLSEYKDAVSPAERSIVNYLLNNPGDAVEFSIYKLSEKTFSSPSTIIRMCRKVGFDGYKEFRRELACELAVRKESKGDEKGEISRSDSMQEIVDKITYKNIISIEETKNLLDIETLMKCVELICGCETICLFGIGSSLCVAKDAYLKFLRLSKPCIINEDWHSQLLQARNMSKNDVGLVISYSGQTVEMIKCMEAMRCNNVPIIAITRFTPSPVSELSTYNIYVSSNESTFRSGAMSSRISQLNIIDIIFTAFANAEYEYSLKQLSKTHIYKPNIDSTSAII